MQLHHDGNNRKWKGESNGNNHMQKDMQQGESDRNVVEKTLNPQP